MITMQMVHDRWNRKSVYTKPAFWDDAAEKYYREAGTNIWVNPHLNELLHEIESNTLRGWTENVAGAEVLDLGCGAGRFAREFADRGARVTAIDFSPKSIEIARRLTSSPSVTYGVGSVYELNADSKYDVIVCSKILSIACVDDVDLDECLEKIFKALKPGGRLLSIEPCHTSFVRRVLSLSFENYKQSLSEAGFIVRDAKVAVFIPARMLLAFFEFPKWLTRAALTAGELMVRILPVTSDQKFVLATKP